MNTIIFGFDPVGLIDVGISNKDWIGSLNSTSSTMVGVDVISSTVNRDDNHKLALFINSDESGEIFAAAIGFNVVSNIAGGVSDFFGWSGRIAFIGSR